MTVLLRLAAVVLLVYYVQSAVPKTRQDQSQPDKLLPSGLNDNSHAQLKSKRTDVKNKKTQIKGNDESKVKSNSNALKTPLKHEDKILKGTKRSAVHSKKVGAKTVKSKTVSKKKPLEVKEFSLNDIIFKGRATNEANAFIKANDKVGKAKELIYEHAREQDLNELEDQIRRRLTAARRR